MKKLIALVLVAALALSAFACAAPAPAAGTETAPAAEAAPAAPAGEPAAEEQAAAPEAAGGTVASVSTVDKVADGDKVTVCWIPICTGIDYFTPIAKGIEDMCAKIGATYTTVAPDAADATSQIPYIETQIQNGVDILLIAPNSTDALNATLQNAIDAGVVVLMVNDDITGNTQYRHGCVIGTNYDKLAEVMFEALVADMGGKGEWAIISSTTDAPFQNNQIAIYEQLAKNYPDMTLVETFYGNDEQNASLSCAETAMDKYPDLAGLLCPTTVAVAAAAQAVSQRGVADKVHVQGCGTPNQMRQYIEDGTVSLSTLWNTYMEGYAGALLGYMIATGKVDPAADTSFEYEGTTFEFGPNGTLYAGAPLVMTKENIADYNF